MNVRHLSAVAAALLILGFPIALVVAWYHGEEGRQQVSGAEILLIALVVAAGAFGLSTMVGSDAQVPTFLDPNHIAVIPFTDA